MEIAIIEFEERPIRWTRYGWALLVTAVSTAVAGYRLRERAAC